MGKKTLWKLEIIKHCALGLYKNFPTAKHYLPVEMEERPLVVGKTQIII